MEGLSAAARTEQNMRVHIAAAMLAILLGIFLKVTATEWLVIVWCIGAVVGMELVNTAVEKLCDFVSPEKRPEIKLVKDLSAAAVLVISLAALIAGLIIFVPRILLIF